MWNKITDMIGYRPLPVIKYMWMIFTPLLTTVSFMRCCFDFLTYGNSAYAYRSCVVGSYIIVMRRQLAKTDCYWLVGKVFPFLLCSCTANVFRIYRDDVQFSWNLVGIATIGAFRFVTKT